MNLIIHYWNVDVVLFYAYFKYHCVDYFSLSFSFEYKKCV